MQPTTALRSLLRSRYARRKRTTEHKEQHLNYSELADAFSDMAKYAQSIQEHATSCASIAADIADGFASPADASGIEDHVEDIRRLCESIVNDAAATDRDIEEGKPDDWTTVVHDSPFHDPNPDNEPEAVYALFNALPEFTTAIAGFAQELQLKANDIATTAGDISYGDSPPADAGEISAHVADIDNLAESIINDAAVAVHDIEPHQTAQTDNAEPPW